jgi:hypothetical protein
MLATRVRRLSLPVLGIILLAIWTAPAGAVSGVVVGSGGAIELISTGAIRIRPRTGTGEVVCNITLRGSFESRLISITGEGARLGAVSGMSWAGCTGGEVEGVLNLAWPITLQRLDGVNPRIAVAERLTEATLRIAGAAVSLSRLGSGTRCLSGGAESEGIELTAPLTLSEGKYSEGSSTVSGTLLNHTEGCVDAVFSGTFGAPTPRQTLTFLAGGEVREAITPSPVEFGNVGAGGLAQRTATVSSTRGGRIEAISVSVGRYFGITDPNGCRGATLSAGGSCSFKVVVSAPAESGRELSDTVTVRIGSRTLEAAVRAST